MSHTPILAVTKDSQICGLCDGSGKNTSGYEMRVNNDICPRCGAYGTISKPGDNKSFVTKQDLEYINSNGNLSVRKCHE